MLNTQILMPYSKCEQLIPLLLVSQVSFGNILGMTVAPIDIKLVRTGSMALNMSLQQLSDIKKIH